MENQGDKPLTGTEPIDMKEGKPLKLEKVLPEDVDKMGRFNKDALRVFALKKFGFSLDLSTHIGIIRGNLIKKCQIALGIILEDPDLDDETRSAIGKVVPLFVRNPKNKRVFRATPALLKRTDLVPCNEDGVSLRASEYFIPDFKPAFKKDSKSEMERIASGMEKQIEQ